MAWIHLTLKPAMSHFGGTKFNNKQPREREDLVLIIAFAWQHAPWCSKDNSREKDGGKKKVICYLACQTVCVFYIDTTPSAQPNMVALPSLAWLSVKQAGILAGIWQCFLLCHFVLLCVKRTIASTIARCEDWTWVRILRCLCTKSLLSSAGNAFNSERWGIYGYNKTSMLMSNYKF